VAIIRFERGMQQGLLARVGRSSIIEFHAFGIISYASILLDATVYSYYFSVREGKHAREHYLICGVQGDFTQSLVKDPPTHLWTRQLKVLFFPTTRRHNDSIPTLSLLESLIRPRFTSEASEFVLVQALEPPYQRVYRKVLISFRTDHI
jgi:hypothetical protein